jgi:hypothetical protein
VNLLANFLSNKIFNIGGLCILRKVSFRNLNLNTDIRTIFGQVIDTVITFTLFLANCVFRMSNFRSGYIETIIANC